MADQLPAGFVPDGFVADTPAPPVAHMSAAIPGTAKPLDPAVFGKTLSADLSHIISDSPAEMAGRIINDLKAKAVDPKFWVWAVAGAVAPKFLSAVLPSVAKAAAVEAAPTPTADVDAPNTLQMMARGALKKATGLDVNAMEKEIANVGVKTAQRGLENAQLKSEQMGLPPMSEVRAAARAQAATPAPAAAPVAPASAPPETPVAQTSPASAATPAPSPTVRGLSDPQIDRFVANQATRQGVTLTDSEAAHLRALVKERGISPAQAVATLKAVKADPSSVLASRLGLPSDADVSAAVADRNATGRWRDR